MSGKITLNAHDVPDPDTLDAVPLVTVIPPVVRPVTDSLKVAVTVIGDIVVTLAAVVAIVTVGATPSTNMPTPLGVVNVIVA